jgi:hypothetical protein
MTLNLTILTRDNTYIILDFGFGYSSKSKQHPELVYGIAIIHGLMAR